MRSEPLLLALSLTKCLALATPLIPAPVPGGIDAIAAADFPDCVGDGYATFYDDNACSKNPGIAVAMNNNGCLSNEYGRNSIYIQAQCHFQPSGNPKLAWFSGSACTGSQVQVKDVPWPMLNGCWNLAGNPGANSFRFSGATS